MSLVSYLDCASVSKAGFLPQTKNGSAWLSLKTFRKVIILLYNFQKMIRFQNSVLPWFQNKSWCSIHIKTCLEEQWYENGNLLVSSMKYFTRSQVHDLGLDSSILAVPSSHPAARSRFIYSRGKLHQLPSGIISIIKKQSLFSKPLLPTILREPFVRGKQDDTDESVYDFFKRRMNEEVCKLSSYFASLCF